ncbi:zinc finger domain-containing protein [Staphylococcus pseudintermedius]
MSGRNTHFCPNCQS